MRRLFEDPQLPSELRDDLLRSRAAGQDYDVYAKLLPLKAALSDAARVTVQQAETSSLPGTTKASSAWHAVPVAWKLAVFAAIGGAAVFAARPASPEPVDVGVETPALKPETPARSGGPASPAPAPAPAPAPEMDGERRQETRVSPQPSAASRPQAPESLDPAARSAPPPGSGARASSARREIAQLARVRALLERDPAAAYRLALHSEREFPGGVLSEERQALLILALEKDGKPQAARRRARTFFVNFPQSPMRGQIEAALGR